MGCYSKYERERLKAYRAQRKLNKARLANYKPLYLAARAARDYFRENTSAATVLLLEQLDTVLIDPHVKSSAAGER